VKPRRPRAKSGKRRINAPTGTERLMLATARKLGIAPKPKRRTEDIGRCLEHCAEELLGFAGPSPASAAWALANFISDLDARRPPGRRKGNIRLPSWKTPPGVRYVVAVRCKGCAGRGCGRCQMYGWGVRLVVAIRKRACENHEAAPAASSG
jgi:hypothetical protein